MKFIALLLGIVAFASAGNKPIVRVPEDRLPKVEAVIKTCSKELNVEPEVFSKISLDNGLIDGEVDRYVYCFAVKAGLVDEIGHIIIDKMAGLLGDHPLLEEFKAALTKCNEITKENRMATVVEMNRCYGATTPVRVVF